MSSTIGFLTDNFTAGITDSTKYEVLSGAEDAQFPMTNLGKVFTTSVFRSTGTNVEIRIDMGAGRTIDTVSLVGHNVDGLGITSATIEFSPTTSFVGASITAFADGGSGQVIVTSASHNLTNGDSVTISGTTNYNGTFTVSNKTTNTFEITDSWVSDDATGSWNKIITIDLSAEHNFGFKYFTEQASMRYAKLVLVGSSYCEISNLYVGKRTELANNNIDTNSFSYSTIENFKSKSNNYGQIFIDKYNTVNTMSGTIKYVNLAEFEAIQNIYAEVGNTLPLWFILDNEGNLSTDGSSKYLFSGYFYLKGALSWTTVAPSLYDTTLALVEIV